MPCKRFWMMEKQIDRIRAEQEIRTVQLHATVKQPESRDQAQRVEEYIGRLVLELGEKSKLRRNIYVAPETSASAKFKKLVTRSV